MFGGYRARRGAPNSRSRRLKGRRSVDSSEKQSLVAFPDRDTPGGGPLESVRESQVVAAIENLWESRDDTQRISSLRSRIFEDDHVSFAWRAIAGHNTPNFLGRLEASETTRGNDTTQDRRFVRL